MFHSATSCAAVLALTAGASAAYIITPLGDDDANTGSVQWGESFSLTIDLDATEGEVHNSVIFSMLFSEPGLILTNYAWSAPYGTGDLFDDSSPDVADLPAVVDGDTVAGPGFPEGANDLSFSNVLIGDTFSEGDLLTLDFMVPALVDGDTVAGPGFPEGANDLSFSNVLIGDTFSEGDLLTLDFMVPANFGFEGTLFIAASPDTIANGFNEFDFDGGTVYQLQVFIPGAPTAALFAAVGLFATRRRRR